MKKELLELITKEDGTLRPIYTYLDHVSKSGMTRHVSVYIAHQNKIYNITHHVAIILGLKRHPRTGGIVIHGCGFDVGFDLVYRLSRRLFADSMNTDKDPGYMLEHRWL